MLLRKLAPAARILAVAIAGIPALASAQSAPGSDAIPSTTPPMNGVAHIAVRVRDIAASVDFYHKLGFEQAFAMHKGDITTQSFLKVNDKQFIELYPVTDRDPQVGFLHLCFEGADLNALHDFYVSEGLTPIAVHKAGAGNLLFTMKGPQQYSEPQNIEYTQYMPESMHSKGAGQHLGPDRVGDKMVVVALAMQDPQGARDYYLHKLGFTPDKTNPALLDLPGNSGEAVEIVPISELGPRSSIVLSTPDIKKAEAQLTRQQVPFKHASVDANGGTTHVEMLSVTDPDGNIIRIRSAR